MKKITGFTLLELIAAVGMSVLVLAGLGAIFAGTVRVWSKIQNTGSALKEGKLAMDWLVRDIRSGTLQLMGINFMKLSTAEYHVPVNFVLKRNLDIVAQNIIPIYTYYDQNGNEIPLMPIGPDVSRVSTIAIKLKIQKGDTVFYLMSRAYLRTSERVP